MQKLPKISVIVPVYNVALFLRQCLNSLLFQSLSDIEIICIDDGSTDGSSRILDAYAAKDARLRVIHQKNQGVSIARNVGLATAKGEFVYFLDSDDYIAQDALEKAYALLKTKKLDILHFTARQVDETGAEIPTPASLTLSCVPKNKQEIVLSPKDCFDFLFNMSVNPGLSIYKRTFLQAHKIRFPKGIRFEDNPFFFIAFLSASRILLTQNAFYFYRIVSTSVTSAKDERQYDLMKAYEHIDVFLKEKKLSAALFMPFLKRQMARLLDSSLTIQPCFKSELLTRAGLHFKRMGLSPHQISALTIREQFFYAQCLEKNKDPFLTIVLPVYHTMPALEKCLKSLYSQSFVSFEVLCFGAEKHGKTAPFLTSFQKKDNRVRMIDAPFSMAFIRNAGLAQAKGKYILFLDAFDCFDWRFLERMVAQIQEQNADVCVCGAKVSEPFYHRTIEYPPMALLKTRKKDSSLYAPTFFNKIFKTAFLRQNQIKFKATDTMEDTSFWSAFLAASPVCARLAWSLVLHQIPMVRDVYRETTAFFNAEPELYRPLTFVQKILRPITAVPRVLYQAHLQAMRTLHAGACPLVLITDEKYAFPTMMTIVSLQKNKKPHTSFDIYVMAISLSAAQRKSLRALSTKDVPVHVRVVRNTYKKFQKSRNPISSAALFKFDIPRVLKTYDKALYLDSDILATRDISELLTHPLNTIYAAVIKDMVGTKDACASRLHLSAYFNSGVMLLNLSKMRRDFMSEQLLHIKQRDSWHYFMDQDTFNVAFNHKVDYLSCDYNYMLENRHSCVADIADFYGLALKEARRIRQKPCFIHYSGPIKPWTQKTDYFDVWEAIYEETLTRAATSK